MKTFVKNRFVKIINLSVLFLFIFSGLAYSSVQFDYVALGDSLAAGKTPDAIYTNTDKSYPDFIAQKLDGEGVLGNYNNYGVIGYTTDDVLSIIDPESPLNYGKIAAISEAEIITLDIGANDLLDLIPTLIAHPEMAETAIGEVVGKIVNIVATLKGINTNPETKIYLMGYYNAFHAFPELNIQQKETLSLLIKKLNLALKEQVAENIPGVTYVDTYTAIDKNLDKYLPEANIHLSVSGYRALAKEFWNIIKVDFLRGLN